ncbi:MAG: hypothetical protein IPM97_10540 [Bdellovibrionaceae bacterium]|nr:hypothetical protein [Pseudobdellovibrionaceae bacterium]
MLQKLTIIFSLVSLLTLGACNESFSPAASSAGGGENNNQSNTPPPVDNVPDPYQSLQYEGYISGGNDSGTLAIDIDKDNGALIVIMPLQLNSFIDSAEGEIPDLPGVKFMTYKNSKGASFIAVSVPLRYVLKGASFLNPARLPNGDPLPQIAGGELPSIGLRIPGKNNVQFHFYIGLDTICIYVSSPFNPYIGMTFPIKRGLSTIGFLSSIPAKAGYDGGFFLSTHMPDEVARIIDDHFRF